MLKLEFVEEDRIAIMRYNGKITAADMTYAIQEGLPTFQKWFMDGKPFGVLADYSEVTESPKMEKR